MDAHLTRACNQTWSSKNTVGTVSVEHDLRRSHHCSGSHDCNEDTLADDLTVAKRYDKNIRHGIIKEDVPAIQASIHKKGIANRVSFDATKEKSAIIHHHHGKEQMFRLLGPLIDPKLQMGPAIAKLYNK